MKTVGSLALGVLFTVVLTIDVSGLGEGPQLDVKLVADGLVAPLDLTFAPDGSGRRFIVDQTGLVLILTPAGQVLPAPFLDITDRVVLQSAFDERGLLAVAFHPQFATNGKLYVQYSARREGPNICVAENGRVPTDPGGCPLQYTRRISEFIVSATDPNRADPSTERVVFRIQWPGRKHNGGGLAFGPDGMLYIGLGDGGFIHGPSGADDPFNVDPDLLFGDLIAQNLTSLYGKILRIDVDRGRSLQNSPRQPVRGPRRDSGRDLRLGVPQPVPHLLRSGRRSGHVRERPRRHVLRSDLQGHAAGELRLGHQGGDPLHRPEQRPRPTGDHKLLKRRAVPNRATGIDVR